ncbi:hypothetical protein ACOTI8_30465 [Achromobacter xylosoxidans]|uniref:hypothetical protein n=1 Tax=Alcaligenes xylosoxydans xylosoxydans TaxID=85698 RepID=UPI0003324011|nr:hypothetical protein [Achromobacter xylosoxidans]CCH04044.1 hypothetical protein NH44784_000521 [Achromobacter xylosoxidans NH44784-1996]
MIRRLLRALLGLDRYEWVGIAGGAVMLAALTGVLGPTLDAQSTITACEGCGKTAVAAKE